MNVTRMPACRKSTRAGESGCVLVNGLIVESSEERRTHRPALDISVWLCLLGSSTDIPIVLLGKIPGEAPVSMVDGAQIAVVNLDGCGRVRTPIIVRERRHCMQETRRRREGEDGDMSYSAITALSRSPPHTFRRNYRPLMLSVSESGQSISKRFYCTEHISDLP